MADEHALYTRPLKDGREITVIPLTYGRARLCIGPQDAQFYEDGW